MRDKILKIVSENPKHYTRLIKNDQSLRDWVENHSLIESESWPEKIYSAVYQVSNRCSRGNTKKLSRWSLGFIGCGPANACPCTKENIALSVASTKSYYTEDDHKAINQKREDSMMAKFGVGYTFQRPELREILTKPKIKQAAYEKLTNKEWMQQEYVDKKRTAIDIATELEVYYGTVISYCIGHNFEIRRTSNYSMLELEISKFLTENGIEHVTNDWSVLQSKELDLYVAGHNFAIEVNGLYFHSYHNSMQERENTQRHLDKTIDTAKRGVSLFHVTDWEWKNKQEIISSMILSKLGKSQRIFARNCQIRQVTTKDARTFVNANHLQGFISGSHYLGLYHDNVLVMMVTAGKHRFDRKYTGIELHRMCSSLGITVVGGASRLLAALKKAAGGKEIVSYCDRSKSDGNGYAKIGFRRQGLSKPGFFWTDGNEVISRYLSRRNKLQQWATAYDPNKSQADNMFAMGYRRYWDCGNLIFVY